MQAECFTEKILNYKTLEAAQRIYEDQSIQDVQVVNLGADEKTQDPAGQLLGQIFTSMKTIKGNMKIE